MTHPFVCLPRIIIDSRSERHRILKVRMVNLDDYERELKRICENARDAGITQSEIDESLENGFAVARNKNRSYYSNRTKLVFLASILITLCVISTEIGYDGKYLTATVRRSLQNFIYPGLKLWRTLALPFIHNYPSLSELYDEWCLVENPVFYVNEMDCRPCAVAGFVPDLTNHTIHGSFDPGIPYIKTENVAEVKIADVKRLVRENLAVFERDAAKLDSNNRAYRTVKDLTRFGGSERSRDHVGWRINRMEPARIVRGLFPRPEEMPSRFEQSVERFLMFDEADAPPYSLPATECANVMVRAAAGARLIRLVASPECRAHCRPNTVLLSPGKILWYNWWYWRPVSLPGVPRDPGSLSITYIASFC